MTGSRLRCHEAVATMRTKVVLIAARRVERWHGRPGSAEATMFQRLRKWFVIRSYARKLSAKLCERYGPSTQYSPNQVAQTVDKCGFNKEWIQYALCMFCN